MVHNKECIENHTYIYILIVHNKECIENHTYIYILMVHNFVFCLFPIIIFALRHFCMYESVLFLCSNEWYLIFISE